MGVLVTGVAGFLGMHVAGALLARGESVYGVDDLAPDQDPALKQARVAGLERRFDGGFRFARADIADPATAQGLAGEIGREVTAVVHLAARRGLPPRERLWRRLEVLLAVLEMCRARLPNCRHVVYACAEGDDDLPSRTASRADELAAMAYARLHGLPLTGMGFGTVYGPWDRPDAELVVLADAIAAGRPVTLAGGPRRLAFAADVATAVAEVLGRPPVAEGGAAPHRIERVSLEEPVTPDRLLAALGGALGQEPVGEAGEAAEGEPDREPRTSLDEGLRLFAAWHAGRGIPR